MSGGSLKHAIVIPGEAPETDDEEEGDSPDFHRAHPAQDSRKKMPPRASSEPIPPPPPKVIKYNSLLHKKLRENQGNLGTHASEFASRQCLSVEKELVQIASGVGSTQQALQDASYKIRLVADTLYKVNDQLDTILSSQDLLPLLKLSDFPALEKTT